jgi:hypothetical protein
LRLANQLHSSCETGRLLDPLSSSTTTPGLNFGGAGILTCFPSPAPYGFDLGSDLFWADEPSPESLGLTATGTDSRLALLMSAFSLVVPPPRLPPRLLRHYNAPLPITHIEVSNSRASVYGLSPIIFGAEALDESAITHCLNGGCL